ncbi:hypothetical protein, partial [Streptomyces yerevanensis]|uniref:hypothetical protein n=1 Tax=Streptomyces yerevanensis TaxID=66378 RepID=UPI001B80126C
MTASDSAAAISKLGDDDFLTRVDGTVHRGHPVGHVEEVAQIPRLGVYALPHLGGVDRGTDGTRCCATRRLVIFPVQLGGTWRMFLGLMAYLDPKG